MPSDRDPTIVSKVTDIGDFEQSSPGVFLLRREEASGAVGEHSEDPTLIILFGWMGAQVHHLLKYAQYYEKLYPYATIVMTQCHPSFFLKSTRDTHALLSPVADILDDLGYIEPGSVSSRSSILVHAFSNGGVAQLVTLSDVLKNRAAKHIPSSMDSYDTPSALILDSAPGNSNIGSSAAAFTITIRSPFIRYPAMSMAWMIFAVLSLFHMLLGVEGANDKGNRALQCPRLLPWIGEGSPRLYIYSKRDALIPYSVVTKHAAEARALGYTVTAEVFDKTMHVAHMRSDPDRYWAAVQRVWKMATATAASRT